MFPIPYENDQVKKMRRNNDVSKFQLVNKSAQNKTPIRNSNIETIIEEDKEEEKVE